MINSSKQVDLFVNRGSEYGSFTADVDLQVVPLELTGPDPAPMEMGA